MDRRTGERAVKDSSFFLINYSLQMPMGKTTDDEKKKCLSLWLFHHSDLHSTWDDDDKKDE